MDERGAALARHFAEQPRDHTSRSSATQRPACRPRPAGPAGVEVHVAVALPQRPTAAASRSTRRASSRCRALRAGVRQHDAPAVAVARDVVEQLLEFDLGIGGPTTGPDRQRAPSPAAASWSAGTHIPARCCTYAASRAEWPVSTAHVPSSSSSATASQVAWYGRSLPSIAACRSHGTRRKQQQRRSDCG